MSAYISSFIFCDSIDQQMTPNGPQFQVNGPLEALRPVAIPSNYSFSISFNIVGIKAGEEHKIVLSITDPSGNECARPIDINFNIDKIEGDNSPYQSIGFNVDIRNLVLRSTGTYAATVCLDESPIGTHKIEAVVME